MKSKKTVLLVEDEQAILYSLQRILELSGEYEVLTALNAKEALKHIKSFLPDLIISDILMPDIDGIEFCKMVRENELTKSIPFIFLTAKKEMMVEGFKVGADDFIIKPFSFDEVVVKIEALFRRVKTSREQATQIKGNLDTYDLDSIMQLCDDRSLTGEVILQSNGRVGKLRLNKGDIEKIEYEKFSEDEALDQLRSWKSGLFVIRTQDMDFSFDLKKNKSRKTHPLKVSEAVELDEGVWWVGTRKAENTLQSNVYLRQFKGGGKKINYLIDPGSSINFSGVSQKIASVIGDISKISMYSLSQPDPDVCNSLVLYQNANPRGIFLTTKDNWQSIYHYDINPQRVKLIDDFKAWEAGLATGQKIKFYATPYCSAPGAFMTYDLQSDILFTGDLFGAASDKEKVNQLFADESDWKRIRKFHQKHFPSNRALRYAIDIIAELDPKPLMLAPQHGSIIRGRFIDMFLTRLYQLDVGLDLLGQRASKEIFNNYLAVCNDLIEYSTSYIAEDQIMQKLKMNAQIAAACDLLNGRVEKIYSRPEQVFEQLAISLVSGENNDIANQVKIQALKMANSRGLPAPLLNWEKDQTLTSMPRQLFTDEKD